MPTTLADLIYNATRRLSYRIAVNGVVLTPSNQATGLNQLTGVPGVLGFGWNEASARIDVSRAPSWMRAGMPVTIDAGFNGLMMRVWTGSVVAMPGEDPDYLRDKVIVRGATVQVGTPPDDVPVELTASATLVGADVQPPLPTDTHIEHEISVPLVWDSTRLSAIAVRELARYGVVPKRPTGEPNRQSILCGGELHKAARAYQLDAIDLDGFTDEDAIVLICDLVGITKRSLIEPSEGWYTLDVGAQVQRGRPLDMLAELMMIGGLEAYHTEDGSVIFRPVEFAPGPSEAWEYDVQDQDLARVIAATGELEVTFNPLVRKYSTGKLNIPYLGYNSERVFARAVRHEINAQGAFTYIDAWGGSRLGGTLAINPIAAFTFSVEREVMGDAVYLVYSCDASASFDPDGSTITYAWTCNRTTTPASLGTNKVMTFRVAADVTLPLTLTLTVTDADALTHAVSVDLPTAADAPEMQIPAIFGALKNQMSATPDGGQNWNDLASLSGDETSVDAKPADGVNAGIACYGYTDGSIKRTTDFAVSSTTVLAADAANGTINEIWWDKAVTTRVWAATSTGRLLRSDDDGVTWVVHKDFGGTYPLYRIATPLGGGVWVFGGRGDVTTTLMQYEAVVGSGVWQSVAVGGELATALVGAGSALHVRSAASRMDGELIILLNGTVPAGSQDNIFYTASVFDPAGAGWTAATGLTAGLTDGREIVPDQAQGTFRAFFGDRSVWNTTNGVAFTETANVLPAGFAPNRVLWLGDYTGHAGTYLIAAEDAGFTGAVYKWLASEATADELRPATGFDAWEAGMAAKGIAIGAAAVPSGSQNLMVVTQHTTPTAKAVRYRQTRTNWQGAEVTQLVTSEDKFTPFCLTRDLWFVAQYDSDAGTPGDIQEPAARTKDGGGTWDTSLSNMASVARATDGRLWGIAYDADDTAAQSAKVYYSDDDGDNWNLSRSVTDGAPPYNYGMKVVCHPSDAQKIFVLGVDSSSPTKMWSLYSADRGATWTYTDLVAVNNSNKQERSCLWLTNDRLVVIARDLTGAKIYTSDDHGFTLTEVYSEAGGTNIRYHAVAGNRSKIVVARMDTSGNPYVGRPLISTDSGATWTLLTPDMITAAGTTTTNAEAWAYDPVTDTLYGALDTGRVFALSPVSNQGVWREITENLMSFSTYSSGTIADGALAVIP